MTRFEYARLRRQVGTQVEVGKALGLHGNTISKRETGEIPVTVEAELALRWLAERGLVGASAAASQGG